MALTTGFTLNDWQQHHQQHPQDVLATLESLLSTLSAEDNAWIYLATPAQLRAQIEPLLATWQQNPASLPLFGVPFRGEG